jgi:hypothetical protein
MTIPFPVGFEFLDGEFPWIVAAKQDEYWLYLHFTGLLGNRTYPAI